jgi:CheY-like chemotaxis protein
MMPVMDGERFLCGCTERRASPEIPVIVVTALQRMRVDPPS